MERMTTRGLAEVLGISSATVNRIERGEMMDAATLARILAWILEIEKAEIA
jgi:DNA-binding XRE family transcriptional regulator